MSSSTSSSSSSHSQRSPLQERTDSEKNKLQIRIVPYSPPRPSDGEGSGRSNAQEPQFGEDDSQRTTTNDPAPITTPKTSRSTIYEKEGYGADTPSPSPSFSTPASPLARVQGRGVSGSKLASDSAGAGAQHIAPPSSPVINRPSYGSNIRRINPQSQPSSSRHDNEPGSAGSAQRKRSFSRRENYINVHSDKTFSIVLKSTRPRHSDRSDSTVKSPPLSNVSTISSHEGSSFDASIEDRLGSPLSSVAERSVSPYTSGSPSTSAEKPEEALESSSPWNYRMVGGLRKVPHTPDLKGKGKEREVSESPLPALPETVTPPEPPSSPLATKPSFNSEQTDSTIEETTNYKVIGRSSPPLPDSESIEVPPSSSSSNYKLLGQSSPAQTIASSAAAPGFTDTPGSRNYIVYGETSPLSSSATPFRGHRYHSSDDSSLQQLRERYSQESLVVPPLRPHKRSSSESFGYYKQQSRESLRGRANSFSSLSSIVSQDTASLFSGSTPNVVVLRHTPSTSSIPRSTWVGTSSAAQQKARMESHLWSSQLSTVMSEYEGSDPGSRVHSAGSIPERVSSAIGSRDSRQMRSISSSLGLENIDTRRSHSRSNSQSDSLDRPSPAYIRGMPSPLIRTVRDHDEHGDGLADLQQLEHRPSRTRLGFSRQSSDRSLRSTSSRAGSLTASSLPSWARLYYGSGERRWLAPLSRSVSVSETGDSRPPSPRLGGGSPAHEQTIHNPRRRPLERDPRNQRPSSMDITPALDTGNVRLGPKKKSSSIWSPHLRLDTRASRFSVWNAPSVTWSADSGVFGRRNIQVVLFVLGFLFPFAWMVAAFLPLPPKPMLAMDERDQSTTEFQASEHGEPPRRHVLIDDSRYQSARWWRNINRFMAVAGLLILGAVAALIVIGVRQKWAQ
ncbi:uncharacterized protein F4822DRAFT_365353 [Hypoxylon trugodes]|uniref:uncharacterized protein n=1 Tax=Hypoxylon trugodes TaxID=326681 RepID=UPI00219116D0|nr:uncharacterized protein F4822DRAFT_365353 [Hypoxylon trugodes]KAI1384491.1 hypothetical protein F4822DRAFT_365353 [Hypoxylon trugodes]